MITDRGQQLIRKNLIGIIPNLVTHIAIGSGALPLLDSVSPSYDVGNSSRTNLKFELVRAAVTSRGIVFEDGVRKAAFQAELPIQNRFGITEVGLYCGGRNLLAAQYDSKLVSRFDASAEGWFMTTSSSTVSALPIKSTGICNISTGNIIVTDKVFGLPNDSDAWVSFEDRKTRYECPRVYDNSIMVRGDYTDITYASGSWTSGSTASNSVETNSLGINMSKNSSNDEIRLAFSVVPVSYGVPTLPTYVNIWFELINNLGLGTRKYAIAKVQIPTASMNSHYHVHTFKLSDFIPDSGFSWSAINGIRIRSSLQNAGAVSSSWYILYDGVRLENITTENPTYGLVAYTQITTPDSLPALKTESTNNFIEFRTVLT